MTNKEIGLFLAREIFLVGKEQGKTPHRIEYKLGEYPDGEIPGGGLCEAALANVIRHALDFPPSGGADGG
jgi:hypothetical protein